MNKIFNNVNASYFLTFTIKSIKSTCTFGTISNIPYIATMHNIKECIKCVSAVE